MKEEQDKNNFKSCDHEYEYIGMYKVQCNICNDTRFLNTPDFMKPQTGLPFWCNR